MFSTTFHGVQEGDVVEARKIEAKPAGAAGRLQWTWRNICSSSIAGCLT